jgi:hypothetical protein
MEVYKKLATLKPENKPVKVISIDIQDIMNNKFQARHPTPISVNTL